MNADAGTSQGLITVAKLIASDLIFLVPALLLAIWIWADDARRSAVIKACLVTLLAMSAAQIIIQVWPHPRPFMIGLGHTWLPHAADSSFPSDHAIVFACLGLTLVLDGVGWFGSAILLAGLGVAWSRIFLGVHFPLDMLGSFLLSGASYLAVAPAWRHVGVAFTARVQHAYRMILSRPIAWGWLHR